MLGPTAIFQVWRTNMLCTIPGAILDTNTHAEPTPMDVLRAGYCFILTLIKSSQWGRRAGQECTTKWSQPKLQYKFQRKEWGRVSQHITICRCTRLWLKPYLNRENKLQRHTANQIIVQHSDAMLTLYNQRQLSKYILYKII